MSPTEEQSEDFLLSCRYGELEEVKAFLQEFGPEAAVGARDTRGNTALHMACGNGHAEILQSLLEHATPEWLSQTNENGSPAIHWAVLNNHVGCVKALVEVSEEKGGGIRLLKQKNRAGRDAFSEALFAGEGQEEVAGWIEGYLWRIEGGEEEGEEGGTTGADGDAEVKLEAGDEVVQDEAEVVDELAEKTSQVDLKSAQ